MKLRIQPKMIIAFLMMGILLLFLAIAAIFYSNRMMQNSERILSENVSSLKAAEELEIALLDMKGLTANYLLDGDEQWLNIFKDKQSVFKKWYQEAINRTHSSEEIDILKEIDSGYLEYLNHQHKVIQLYSVANQDEAISMLTEKMKESFDQTYTKCEELLYFNEKMMYQTSELIKNDNQRINSIMYGLGLASLLFGLTLGVFIARSITKPLYRIVLKMKDATSNEISDKLDISDETELQKLDEHAKLLIEQITKANEDLEKSRQLLIRSERLAALGKMASGLAHEIRNPLTAIKMLIFALKNDFQNDPVKEQDYQVILREISRLERFIQEFLDFARPAKPAFSDCRIEDIIEKTLSLLSAQIKDNKIKIIKEYSDYDIQFKLDKDQMQQVFVNLMINAIHAMPGGGELNIKTSLNNMTNSTEQIYHIIISDTGSGIPEDLLDRIFDPFVSGSEDGTGLGLAIAHQIVTNHGGWIEAENTDPEGAKFILSFKVNKENNE